MIGFAVGRRCRRAEVLGGPKFLAGSKFLRLEVLGGLEVLAGSGLLAIGPKKDLGRRAPGDGERRIGHARWLRSRRHCAFIRACRSRFCRESRRPVRIRLSCHGSRRALAGAVIGALMR